jgi:ribonuclease-3
MAKFFAPFNYTFNDEKLLKAALTHRSLAHECPLCAKDERDNQRLEFLGDAVLDLYISEYLFSVRPKLLEGTMSKIRSCFVCESRLAEIARNIRLGSHLIVSQTEHNAGGRNKNSLLADAMEALLGAVYLDGGHERTRAIILELWKPFLSYSQTGLTQITDHKTALQEFSQKRGMGLPIYSHSSTNGPAHNPTFLISVKVADHPPRTAMAHSKKEAAQEAAKLLLQDLMEEYACEDQEGADRQSWKGRGEEEDE